VNGVYNGKYHHPPCEGDFRRCHLGKKYGKGEEKKGKNMKENRRKGKEKEKMGSKRVK
jgi:hypothetical protein